MNAGPLIFAGSSYDYQTAAQVTATVNAAVSAEDAAIAADLAALDTNGQLLLSARDYGAVGNGIADDTAAIQAAIDAAVATGRLAVYLPAGTYKVSGTLTIGVHGLSLTGAGREATILTANSAAQPIITISSGVTYVTVRSMTLTRSVAATSGGNGITATGVYEGVFLHDLYVEKQYNGLALGAASNGKVRDVLASKCINNGVLLQTTTGTASMQWNIEDVLVVQCSGNGFAVVPGGTQTTISLGEWINVQTYANSACGITLAGTVGCPINGLRILGGFLGEDGNSELLLNTYGGLHVIRHLFCELAGRNPTGPTLATAASHVGNGVEITANNFDVCLTGVRCDGNSYNGIQSSCTDILINACRCSSNGAAAVGGSQNGISIPAGRAMINGNSSGGGATQLYGVALAAGAGNAVVCNDLVGNATLPLVISATATQVVMMGNLPSSVNTMIPGGGVMVGVTALGPNIAGGINTLGGIAKDGTVYTNP